MRLDPRNLNPHVEPKKKVDTSKVAEGWKADAPQSTPKPVSNLAKELAEKLITMRAHTHYEKLVWHAMDMHERLKKDFSAGDAVLCMQVAIALLHKCVPELVSSYEIVRKVSDTFVEQMAETADFSKVFGDKEPKFAIGPIMIDLEVERRVPREGLYSCIARHAQCDYGYVPEAVVDYNNRSLESRSGPITSRYKIAEGGHDIVILTQFDGEKSSTGVKFFGQLGPLGDILFNPVVQT